jgi:hypothetical protein
VELLGGRRCSGAAPAAELFAELPVALLEREPGAGAMEAAPALGAGAQLGDEHRA